MEQAIPASLQYGAMGILALAFLAVLLLFWRTDKRSQAYADRLGEASFDRSTLITIVQENTRINANLAAQIAEMTRTLERSSQINQQLEQRLAEGRCPLLEADAAGGNHTRRS
jgi:hypothetical protein